MYPPVSLSHLVIRLERKSTNERGESCARGERKKKKKKREIARKKEAGGGTSLFGSWEGEGEVVRGVSHGARANCSFIMHRNARNDATRVDSTL